MVKPITTRSPFPSAMEQSFEEVPLVWQVDTSKTVWTGGLVDGQMEISYGPDGDWWISDVWISVDNGRTGYEAKGKLLNISPEANRDLYVMLVDSIEEAYASRIDEWVDDELNYADAA